MQQKISWPLRQSVLFSISQKTFYMKKLIKEEAVRFLFGLAATAIGVFVALWVDSLADRRRDRDSYQAMLRAIRIEATENQFILDQSFLPHYKTGVVRRGFITTACDNALVSRIFLDHAPQALLGSLTKYNLALDWANGMRLSDEKYKYDTLQYQQWEADLQRHFTTVLDSCKMLIPAVVKGTASGD
jgi:hypothetical protein